MLWQAFLALLASGLVHSAKSSAVCMEQKSSQS